MDSRVNSYCCHLLAVWCEKSFWILGDDSTHLLVLWSFRKQHSARSTHWPVPQGCWWGCWCQVVVPCLHLLGSPRVLTLACVSLHDWPWFALRPLLPLSPSLTTPAHQSPSLPALGSWNLLCPWLECSFFRCICNLFLHFMQISAQMQSPQRAFSECSFLLIVLVILYVPTSLYLSSSCIA